MAVTGSIAGPVLGIVGPGPDSSSANSTTGVLTPPLLLGLQPLYTSPPTFTITKGFGLFTVAVSGGGSSYVNGDTITLSGTGPVKPLLTVTNAIAGVIQAAGVAITTPGVLSVSAGSFTQTATSGSGTGATFTGTMFGFAAASMPNPVTTYTGTGSIGNETNFRWDVVEPLTNVGSSGYFGSANYAGTHATFEFMSDATSIDVQLIGLVTSVDVYIDGVRATSAYQSTDSSGQPYTLNINWGGSQPLLHTYKVIGFNLAVGAIAITSTASEWTPTYIRQPLAYWLGDSYTFGTGATDISQALASVMGYDLGFDIIPSGIGGTGWTSTGANLPQTRVSADLLLRTQRPTYVFLALGFNDASSMPGAASTITTNLNAAVAAIQAGLPDAHIFVVGPWTPVGTTTNLDTVRATLLAGATALGLPFIDVRNWVNTTNQSIYTDVDLTHPNNAGHAFLGTRIALAVAPYLT